jgi:hypothetical protein
MDAKQKLQKELSQQLVHLIGERNISVESHGFFASAPISEN